MLIYPTILKLGRNDSGPKRPTYQGRNPKRPTPKIGRNYSGRNDPAETTRNPSNRNHPFAVGGVSYAGRGGPDQMPMDLQLFNTSFWPLFQIDERFGLDPA